MRRRLHETAEGIAVGGAGVLYRCFSRFASLPRDVALGLRIILARTGWSEGRRSQAGHRTWRRRWSGNTRGLRAESQALQGWRVELSIGIQTVRDLIAAHGFGGFTVPFAGRRAVKRAIFAQGGLNFIDAVGVGSLLTWLAPRSGGLAGSFARSFFAASTDITGSWSGGTSAGRVFFLRRALCSRLGLAETGRHTQRCNCKS